MIFLGETGLGVPSCRDRDGVTKIPPQERQSQAGAPLVLWELILGCVGDGVLWGQGLCWVAKCTGRFCLKN